MLLRVFDIYVIDGFVNLVANVTVMITRIARWFDQGIIDGLVNGVAWFVDQCSRGIKYMQSGYIQNYYMAIALCILGYILIESRDTIFHVGSILKLVLYQLGLPVPGI
jgi:NADH:ubiquinone oxidoreductase subunit 5 (subunit L)/multisubunit Na+/H+ antiporter MnhA subunit